MVSSQLKFDSSPHKPRKQDPLQMFATAPLPKILEFNASNTFPLDNSETAAMSKERHSNSFVELMGDYSEEDSEDSSFIPTIPTNSTDTVENSAV